MLPLLFFIVSSRVSLLPVIIIIYCVSQKKKPRLPLYQLPEYDVHTHTQADEDRALDASQVNVLTLGYVCTMCTRETASRAAKFVGPTGTSGAVGLSGGGGRHAYYYHYYIIIISASPPSFR